MKQLFSHLVLAAGVLSGGAAQGPAAAATNSLTLEALVADVLEHNPELNFYTAEVAAAKGERRTASTRQNPEVATEIGRKSVRGGGLSDEGLAWSVALKQPFEWPGRIPLRKAIANRQVKLAELGYAQFKAALASKARTLAYNVFASQQKATAAREVADRFHALREVLVQRDPAGLTPALELRIIESTEITMQRDATQEELAAQSALLELNQLRGQPFTNALSIAEPKLLFGSAPSSDALIDAARTNNFELMMRKAELEQQGFKVSLARHERYPTVSVGPFLSQERAGDTENIVGVGVSIPVPLWNRNKGNIETAKARELQAQTSFLITQLEVERKVTEQRLRYETKLNEMSKWRPDSIEQFREAATLSDRHYRLGAVPVATYVELQKQYLEAVEALLDTKREALEAGQQLELLTGVALNGAAKEQKNQ
ncbi:MAG TPA: TolC family protein [Verrucomicrobiae bacterium]|nr:TolC family protein [Verrucomicrobiae bacterium]